MSATMSLLRNRKVVVATNTKQNGNDSLLPRYNQHHHRNGSLYGKQRTAYSKIVILCVVFGIALFTIMSGVGSVMYYSKSPTKTRTHHGAASSGATEQVHSPATNMQRQAQEVTPSTIAYPEEEKQAQPQPEQQLKQQPPPQNMEENTVALQSNQNMVKMDPIPPDENGVYDIAILGAGPAGLSAALFGARAGLSVLVFGSQSGLLSETEHLDNFPSFSIGGKAGGGPGWLQVTRQQAKSFGANFAPPGLLVESIARKAVNTTTTAAAASTSDKQDGVFVLATPQQPNYQAHSVIVATGAKPRHLGLPKEDKLWGKSLHSCAICDGSMYKNQTVIVVGGGDAAMDAALLLARHAQQVILVHRRESFRASNQASVNMILTKQVPNIKVMTSYVVEAWETTTSKTATTSGSVFSAPQFEEILVAAKLKHTQDGTTVSIPCNGAFLMIGADPNTAWLKNNDNNKAARNHISLDDEGFIQLMDGTSTTTTTTLTSWDGVFAAGEVTDKIYRQAITASAQGAQAAMDAERWLRQKAGGIRNSKIKLAPIPAVSKETEQKNNPPPLVAATPGAKERTLAKKEHVESGKDKNNNGNDDCDLVRPECIQQLVNKHVVVVFSKPWCPYCRKALEALALAGIPDPHVVDLSTYGRKTQDIQYTLMQLTGRRTVPNVFVGGESIGGGDETAALQRAGNLVPLLRKAGALPAEGKESEAKQPEENDKDNNSDKNVIVKTTDGKNNDMVDPESELCALNTKECIIELTKKYPVLLFTLKGCPECTRMFELLDLLDLQIPPKLIDLKDHPNESMELRFHLLEMTGSQSVPSLFVGGESLGGFSKTNRLHQEGKLVEKFQAVGAITTTSRQALQAKGSGNAAEEMNHNNGKDTITGKTEDKNIEAESELCDLNTKECMVELTKKYPVLLFTLRGCPECTRMFELLDLLDLQIPPKLIELRDHPEEYMMIRKHLAEMAGTQSVPSLFVGGETLGGFVKTNKLYQEGKLVEKFQAVGAIKTA